MEIVRAEHVARLLSTQNGDPVLVVHEGRADVVEEADLDGPRYAGALRVIGRADLLEERGGARPGPEETEALARRLDTAVQGLGG
ncbi:MULTISPECIES: hypothetical protein [Nocardiopsis]|uniref:Uncharacterized protein n=1 Tax=Nocardiopsis dassonvillei (strain ATCC 23218 / DSM 43111 / CIP 107115 / JCM 7437 / KCTC 9190 / NBRC 14626 / NCTC 10488 / NRRL B-5397 / IMRU 509) TaxID=446468 RepID=D7AY11_NOCDD|nr:MULTISPECIES: hypothetical protein [Nocardiopsis]ADH69889.1 conserved hypothetical protein [Nocardiopsis dassonvillei subsp. dassonvillei DSM 43111]APC37876.1 hypothetical protein A9R04_25805 [Nocardiopsis dassonvillei]NKY78931.1 hypothetical protein [Nocardiopsis dassonvillei]VEI90402.1 Uncharacterised protein [Nocardiopsis dassonvillei]